MGTDRYSSDNRYNRRGRAERRDLYRTGAEWDDTDEAYSGGTYYDAEEAGGWREEKADREEYWETDQEEYLEAHRGTGWAGRQEDWQETYSARPQQRETRRQREDRESRSGRRRARQRRREKELRRMRTVIFAAAGVLLAVVVAVILTRLVNIRTDKNTGNSEYSGQEPEGSTAAASAQTEASQNGEEISAEDSEGSADSIASAAAGDEEVTAAWETAADETAAALYAYYETGSTLQLGESATDISIYDAQRHIASAAGAGTDTGTQTGTEPDSSGEVYGDSADAADTDASGEDAASAEDYIDSQYVILVNADTDEILAVRNAYDQIVPASMTKVMTLLVAVEAMEDYGTQKEDTFTITQEITDAAYLSGSSFVGYGVGDEATVEDLLYGTILPSGADAAMALAEYTAGSQDAFVALMNEKVSELGLSGTTHFSNVIGLYDDGANYSTPYDMCVIMNAAIDNELCRTILQTRTWTTQPIMDNPEGTTISNWFLRRAEDHIDDWTVLCGKTGYVSESGNCAVSYLQSADGTGYLACTALTYSSWRCIFDHAALYNYYIG